MAPIRAHRPRGYCRKCYTLLQSLHPAHTSVDALSPKRSSGLANLNVPMLFCHDPDSGGKGISHFSKPKLKSSICSFSSLGAVPSRLVHLRKDTPTHLVAQAQTPGIALFFFLSFPGSNQPATVTGVASSLTTFCSFRCHLPGPRRSAVSLLHRVLSLVRREGPRTLGLSPSLSVSLLVVGRFLSLPLCPLSCDRVGGKRPSPGSLLECSESVLADAARTGLA